jgi:hypothetical protein
MLSKERSRRIFRGESVDRIGCFEQTITSSVASGILGRVAYPGGQGLEYHEACSWWEGGEKGHQESIHRVWRDILDISARLGFDLIQPRAASLNYPPSKRLAKYTFCFGQDEDEMVMKFSPEAETWGVIKAPPKKRNTLSPKVEALEKKLLALNDDTLEASFDHLKWFVKRVGQTKSIVGGNWRYFHPSRRRMVSSLFNRA